MGSFRHVPPPPPIRDLRALAASSTATPPSWCRKGSTSIPAPAPATTPRSCFPRRLSGRRSSSRAGAPIRSASPWWRNWSKACCDRMRATRGGGARCARRARARDLRPLSRTRRPRRRGLARSARRARAPARSRRHARGRRPRRTSPSRSPRPISRSCPSTGRCAQASSRRSTTISG